MIYIKRISILIGILLFPFDFAICSLFCEEGSEKWWILRQFLYGVTVLCVGLNAAIPSKDRMAKFFTLTIVFEAGIDIVSRIFGIRDVTIIDLIILILGAVCAFTIAYGNYRRG
jgi:hypothetical protein